MTKGNKFVQTFLIMVLLLGMTACKKEETATLKNENSSSPLPGLTDEAKASATTANLGTADFSKLQDILATQLKNTIGYTAVISYNGNLASTRSSGLCRQSQNAPSRSMSSIEKYSIASVSKTITAAALLKLMSTTPDGIYNVLAPIWTYLPSHWTFGPNIKKITLYQLLTHTSGFRSGVSGVGDGDDYKTLKALVAKGVNTADMTRSYNNRNFALLRLIIPKMAKYNISVITATDPLSVLIGEAYQDQQCALYYKDYCRKTIFSKLGSCLGQVIDCKNTNTSPALYYQYPKGSDLGFSVGDLTYSAGGQGWVLSNLQMDDFFRTLHYTEHIIPKFYSDYMKSLLAGYDFSGTTTDGIGYYWKNGIYTTNSGAGYRSLIIGFDDGIQISIMANSPINLQMAAIAAHQIWHP